MNIPRVGKTLILFAMSALLLSAQASAAVKKYIVLFNAEVSTQQLDDLKATSGVSSVSEKFQLVHAAPASMEESSKAAVEAKSYVASVSLDEDQRLLPIDIANPSEKRNAKMKRLNITGNVIGSQAVHGTFGARGQGVKVCVLDTGMISFHTALPTPIKTRNFLVGGTNVNDGNGHGTHVAGTIASANALYLGIAPSVSLMIGKVLSDGGSGTFAGVINGMDWCVAQGADIISMSLGGGSFVSNCDNTAVGMALNAAVAQGVVVTVASGNASSPDRLSMPACASKAVAVGATNNADLPAYFSNGSPLLWVVAPGYPVRAPWNDGGYRTISGTSMSTPHVAGVMALMMSASKPLQRTPAVYRAVIKRTAKDLLAAGHDYKTGWGRVDAYAAVSMIKDMCSQASDLALPADCNLNSAASGVGISIGVLVTAGVLQIANNLLE